MRHIAVRELCVEDLVREKKIMLRKINGHVNAADLLTRPLARADLDRLLELVNGFIQPET